MEIIIVKDYDEMSRRAAEYVLNTVKKKSDAVLGLATGSTPVGLYRFLAEDHIKNGTSYRDIRTVNLDEYIGLDSGNEHSYAAFMRKNLFDAIDIRAENVYIEDGKAADPAAECERYNSLLANMRQDVQILGIGSNGHIAFNEPGTPHDSLTHVVRLAESTIKDNSRLFDSISDVPRSAFTMGIGNIMNAKKIIVLASGKNKAKAVRETVRGGVTEEVPASVLQKHGDCVLICDVQAAELILEE